MPLPQQQQNVNDPRVTLQKLKAGDPITESFLGQVVDGINERRGISSPPTQVLRAKGSSGTTLVIAKLASTANVASLSGHPTIDGVVTADNDVVLLKNQSTASQNGTYIVLNAGWTKIGQPSDVFVTAGTAATNLRFVLTTTNTYVAGAAAYS